MSRGDLGLQLEGARRAERKSLSSRVESWKESWMWSRPASFSGLRACSVKADARGDAGWYRSRGGAHARQLCEVLAQQRLAARKAELHCAEGAGLANTSHPRLQCQLVAMRRKVERVRAEHAMQRAAVRQLRQQPQRRAAGATQVARVQTSQPRCIRLPEESADILAQIGAARSRAQGPRSSSPPRRGWPSQRRRISAAGSLSLTIPSG